MTFRPLPGLTIAALIALVILLSLGTWQVQRLAWKNDLTAKMEARTTARPISLAEAIRMKAGGGDVAYLPVRLKGSFLHDQELHLFTVEGGKMGRRIITPFKTADGRAALVDRGFVPDSLLARDKRKAGLDSGLVELTGQIRLGGRPGLFVPDNRPAENDWYWRDHAGMAAAAGIYGRDNLVPFFIEASQAATGGWPNGRATRPRLINNHLEYALTWYALALVMLVIYFTLHHRAGRLSFSPGSR